MNKENNKTEPNLEIIKSLEDLIFICKKLNCRFRIFGSLIYAALKGKFYREIGDIDCFIDNNFKKVIVEELKKKGYARLAIRDEDIPLFLYFIGFRTENFIKNHNKLSLFFVLFKKEYMEIPLKFGLSFRTPYNLINKNYRFYGKGFIGLIPEAAFFNLFFLKDKIKRNIDANILLSFCDFDIIKKIKNTDTFFWFNKRIPLI
ncbi:hypothetical protein AMJ49_02065 [Parcubacteria bacterium DG_74_2]|nr:MAG: hypothetical protein AMJ49_02065 [Parcubacteria bacterium DG_74_2]